MVIELVTQDMVKRDGYGINIVQGNDGIPLVPCEGYKPYFRYIDNTDVILGDNEYLINTYTDEEYETKRNKYITTYKNSVLELFSRLTLEERVAIVGCKADVVDAQIRVYEELYNIVIKDSLTDIEELIIAGHASLSDMDVESYKELIKVKARLMKDALGIGYITLELKKRLINRLIEEGYGENTHVVLDLLKAPYTDEYETLLEEYKNESDRTLSLEELKG